ncbi:MAG: ATP-grasp domain-containing protein [Bdellovibrionales bacterium]|nr:ATP-grasp domain-containing protein [Bdellovibrionales bacterium]
MRQNLAENRGESSPRALVLGPPGVSRRIAADLEAEGIRALLPGDLGLDVPLPTSPGAEAKLRVALSAFADPRLGGRSLASTSESYIHPGVSPWADRPELSRIGQEMGLAVVAPPPKVLSLFANKLSFLAEADRQGLPHLVLSFEPVQSLRETERLIEELPTDSPVVLKSLRGSAGGVGVRVVQDTDELRRALPLWIDQLRLNFGEAMFFVERYLEGARRVVQPFCRLPDGHLEFFPTLDASLTHRSRKIIEFCPSQGIEEAEPAMRAAAASFLESCGYLGVGCLEFLVEGERFHLIEGLARLNTGYHLWERVAGTRAIAWQLAAHTERGRQLAPGRKPERQWACGVAVRLYAEDALRQLPQPGMVLEVPERTRWSEPGARGSAGEAELDLAVAGGQEVPPRSDGFLGSLWVGGPTRERAQELALQVLSEVWIAGSLQTNERYVAEILSHPWVRQGVFHAGFVDEEFIPELGPPPELARAAVALCRALAEGGGGIPAPQARGARVLSMIGLGRGGARGAKAVEIPEPEARWFCGDRWIQDADPAALSWDGPPRTWEQGGRPGVSGWILLGAETKRRLRLCAFPEGESRWVVRLGGWVMPVRRRAPRPAGQAKVFRLSALVKGRVRAILYRKGAEVPGHEALAIVESLQTLVPHALPAKARVIQWHVRAEDEVHWGQDLADVDLLE